MNLNLLKKKANAFDIPGEKTNVKIFNIDSPLTNSLIQAERFEIKFSRINEETPLILYFYGKDWKEESEDCHYNYCTHLCNLTQSMVIKINPTSSAFSKFPNAALECYEAIKWVWQACSFWKINREKIYIFAEVCGANNAISALLRLRDEKSSINIAGIILINPLVDCRFVRKSNNEFEKTTRLQKENLKKAVGEYIKDGTEIFNPNLSLILHKDWTRLSNILLIASKKNPLWDDSVSLYHKINESEGNIIFYPLEKAEDGFLYKKKYPEKKIIERLITTFISNNDPSYFKLAFKD